MSSAEPHPTPASQPDKPRRRWLRVALLTALIGIGVIGMVLIVIGLRPGPVRPEAVGASASTTSDGGDRSSSDRTRIQELPFVPWEGGPAYWKKFPNAVDWTDPTFFPIGIWYGNVSSDEEVVFDKSKGINTYVEMWEGTDFDLLARNEVYWLGRGLVNQDDSSKYNPGVFLDDEVDGRYEPEKGLEHLARLRAKMGTDRFTWANFTQLVIGPDLEQRYQLEFVNQTADAVSVDMYWYSIPFCDWKPYRGDLYAVPVPQQTCRTAHSYGLSQEALRLRDATDGRLQPTWTWVENFNGLSGQDPRPYITGGQLKGAAMATLIHEARALMWFNQSFTGPCQTGNVIRQAQVDPASGCGRQYAANIEAMSEVNHLVSSLAPILNTQSRQWSFGTGLDTMLKVHDGHAYIFAMTDGTSGRRTFRLPKGIGGNSAEVVGEGRAVALDGDSFSDNFSDEYTYHVYKINL
ncbi:MAG: hypothetical protein L0H41_15005 [Microlunatus sp.]|nr:hypothetical protein [Microlunatus sp.]